MTYVFVFSQVHLAADFDKKQGVWNVPKDGAFVQRTHDKLRKTFILNFDISSKSIISQRLNF